ncbi:MAG: hypothetical protein LKF31_02885 [Muribaculaceae bacterium]|jgi:hypothetical protein|nr:hypothetical protein [Muribaculaceae bacterium]
MPNEKTKNKPILTLKQVDQIIDNRLSQLEEGESNPSSIDCTKKPKAVQHQNFTEWIAGLFHSGERAKA